MQALQEKVAFPSTDKSKVDTSSILILPFDRVDRKSLHFIFALLTIQNMHKLQQNYTVE